MVRTELNGRPGYLPFATGQENSCLSQMKSSQPSRVKRNGILTQPTCNCFISTRQLLAHISQLAPALWQLARNSCLIHMKRSHLRHVKRNGILTWPTCRPFIQARQLRVALQHGRVALLPHIPSPCLMLKVYGFQHENQALAHPSHQRADLNLSTGHTRAYYAFPASRCHCD